MRRGQVCWRIVSTVLLLAAFGSLPDARAQNSSAPLLETLRGTVRGPGGSSLSDVTILLKNSQSGETRTASTNAQGQFDISGLAPGRYEVTASHPNFAAQTRNNVELKSRETLLEFELRSGAEPESGGGANRIS